MSAALLVVLAPAAATGQAVFINELHYDNAGTDAGEAIEVAGEAGTRLDGWRVVLYGSAGSAYAEYRLEGRLPDQAAGFGVAVVALPANGLQNGPADGVALVDALGSVVQFLSYEGPCAAVDGPAAGRVSEDIGVAETGTSPAGTSLQLTGLGRRATDFIWEPGPASFGEVNARQTFADLGPPRTERVSAIQGRSERSPLEGRPVIVEGVVTASFQRPGELDGFFIEELGGDGDPATSDGLFVHVPGAPFVPSGTVVRVVGTVREVFGQTLLANITALDAVGTGRVAPTLLDLPRASVAEFERYEGMLVTLAQPVTVTGTDALATYGEVLVSSGGRLMAPTGVFDPNDDPADGVTTSGGANMAAIDVELARQAASTLVLDDGMRVDRPERLPLIGSRETLRLGARLHGVTGVVSYEFGAYRVHATASPLVEEVNARPAEPPWAEGGLRVASLNVLNFFTTLGRRGAATREELDRQRTKLVAALGLLDADVVGLVEIEANGDGDQSAVAALTRALNERAGSAAYDYVRDPLTGVGSDEIKVAILYKRSAVTPVGASSSPSADVFERRPVAQAFRDHRTGERLSVVVSHLRSKRGPGSPDDEDRGQGAFNRRRVLQAEALAAFATEVARTHDDPDVLLIGDLNAYGEEDPIDALRAAGFANLAMQFDPGAYSYVFEGRAGLLDHAFATTSLERQVSGAAVWHINADEPEWLDYHLDGRQPGRTPDRYTPTPYRSSDHDPVLVTLSLGRH